MLTTRMKMIYNITIGRFVWQDCALCLRLACAPSLQSLRCFGLFVLLCELYWQLDQHKRRHVQGTTTGLHSIYMALVLMANGPSNVDIFGTVDEFVGNNLNVAPVSAMVFLTLKLKSRANISKLESQLLVN